MRMILYINPGRLYLLSNFLPLSSPHGVMVSGEHRRGLGHNGIMNLSERSEDPSGDEEQR